MCTRLTYFLWDDQSGTLRLNWLILFRLSLYQWMKPGCAHEKDVDKSQPSALNSVLYPMLPPIGERGAIRLEVWSWWGSYRPSLAARCDFELMPKSCSQSRDVSALSRRSAPASHFGIPDENQTAQFEDCTLRENFFIYFLKLFFKNHAGFDPWICWMLWWRPFAVHQSSCFTVCVSVFTTRRSLDFN